MAANPVLQQEVAAARPKSRRQPELDALRGFMLMWMTITHLPTHASVYSNQPFGFVSAAEGFIFLSALLCGRVFGRKLEENGFRDVLRRLAARAGRLYIYHLLLLGVAFTVVAKLAVHTGRPSLQGLVDFYLAHPVRGVVTSMLLIYRPPLLDILPMYILFLLCTPFALLAGARWGWKAVLVPSLVVWTAAQFGLRAFLYQRMLPAMHFSIPFGALGAFDLYAWQLLWIVGLWIGSGRPGIVQRERRHKFTLGLALAIAVAFAAIRHTPLWDVLNQNDWTLISDKWHLAALRLLNFAAVTTLFASVQAFVARHLVWKPLVLIGRSSLEVFCAHLLICFAALAAVGDGTGLPFWPQAAILISSLLALYGVARVLTKERRED